MYEVSNHGRVRSLDRYDEINHFHPGKILSMRKKDIYKQVHLSRMGKAEWNLVHRLVAEAFLEKPEGCDIVNHVDNNPQNNNVWNLEWTTFKGNMQWAAKQGRMHYNPENLRKAQKSREIPIVAISPDGTRQVFNSQVEAMKALGLSDAQRKHIAAVCRGDYGYKSSGGYGWEYFSQSKRTAVRA